MKKHFAKISAFLLALSLTLTVMTFILPDNAAAGYVPPTDFVRVGITYGSDAGVSG